MDVISWKNKWLVIVLVLFKWRLFMFQRFLLKKKLFETLIFDKLSKIQINGFLKNYYEIL